MGLYAVACPQCGNNHLWFSGNMDQRCTECKKGETQKDKDNGDQTRPIRTP